MPMAGQVESEGPMRSSPAVVEGDVDPSISLFLLLGGAPPTSLCKLVLGRPTREVL